MGNSDVTLYDSFKNYVPRCPEMRLSIRSEKRTFVVKHYFTKNLYNVTQRHSNSTTHDSAIIPYKHDAALQSYTITLILSLLNKMSFIQERSSLHSQTTQYFIQKWCSRLRRSEIMHNSFFCDTRLQPWTRWRRSDRDYNSVDNTNLSRIWRPDSSHSSLFDSRCRLL